MRTPRRSGVPIEWRVGLAGVSAIGVSFGFARYGYGLFLPEIRRAFDMPVSLMGVIGSGTYVGYLAALTLVGVLATRVGPRPLVVAAGASAATGMALVALAPGTGVLVAGLVLAGTSSGWAWAPYSDTVQRMVPTGRRERVLALLPTGTAFGTAIAGALALAAQDLNWRHTWLLFAGIAVLVTVYNARLLPGRAGATATEPVLPERERASSVRDASGADGAGGREGGTAVPGTAAEPGGDRGGDDASVPATRPGTTMTRVAAPEDDEKRPEDNAAPSGAHPEGGGRDGGHATMSRGTAPDGRRRGGVATVSAAAGRRSPALATVTRDAPTGDGGRRDDAATPATSVGRGPGRVAWLARWTAVPLYLTAGSYGLVGSVYWTFSAELVSAVGGGTSAGPLFWSLIGVAGTAGMLTGSVIARLGLRVTHALLFVVLATAVALPAAAPGALVAVALSALLYGPVFMAVSGLLAVWSYQVFPDRPSTGFSAVVFFLGVGTIAGPAALGAIAAHTDLRVGFLLAAVVAVLTVAARPAARAPAPAGPRHWRG